MWQATTESLPSGTKYRLHEDSTALSCRQFTRLLQRDDDFADWYSALLASSRFDAFYWELPPVTLATYDEHAEFVLIDAPALATLAPEPAPFQPQFDAAPDEGVLVFPNLGGDATLIVPRPICTHDAYPHLAAFVRQGPPEQIRIFWQCIAETVYQVVTTAPRWLSTAGLGVAWLHARIDSRPKYYSHMPYTRRC